MVAAITHNRVTTASKHVLRCSLRYWMCEVCVVYFNESRELYYIQILSFLNSMFIDIFERFVSSLLRRCLVPIFGHIVFETCAL
ncbi:hypothetical protein QL285_045232 [Trifolium repens]|nr:hypothetical protein QL285_045232 [Trifolium repens]